MLNLINNLRLNKIKSIKSYNFKSELNNFSTSELEQKKAENSNLLPSQTWLELYRCQ